LKRLLVLSASAGAGHTRAAQALAEAARDRGAQVEHADILEFTSPFYRRAYADGYLQMVNRAPELWGYLYRASDRRSRPAPVSRFVRLFDRLEFGSFRKFVRSFRPDAVLTTHFLACQVFAPYRQRGRDRFPLGVVVTDFDAHAFWVQPTADHFFVATDEVAAVLTGRGIARGKIAVTGIPIAAPFARRHDRAAARRELGLRSDRPVVLVLSGGAGVGAFAEAVRAVLGRGPVQVLAVAGRNERLRRSLAAMRARRGSTLSVFGFVEDIASVMAAADLAVGKSGGLTASESLAMGLPLVVFNPIPGQEERNADFLLEAGAGVKAIGPASLAYKVGELLEDRARRERMRRAARRAARPRAARDIVVRMGF
jgi:processive 1,2-diacylglycerol beta-glucosyltransferase